MFRMDPGKNRSELNRQFPMPVMIVFKHGASLTLSIINRRLNRRDEQRDVLEKVTLIKDISHFPSRCWIIKRRRLSTTN